MEHDMQPPVKIVVIESPPLGAAPPLALRERLEKRTLYSRQEAVEEKLLRAQRARQDMRLAALAKRHKFERRVPRSSCDKKALKLKLQTRLDTAASVHSAQVEERRNKATRFLARNADALARKQMYREEQLERQFEEQLHEEEVVNRRFLQQQLKREKLRQMHSWVQSRLVMHRVSSLSLEGRRLLLDERLSLARQARSMQLGVRAARAGIEVSRARSMRLAAQVRAKERAEATWAHLQEKMQAAEDRRQAILVTVCGHMARTSSGGSGAVM